MRAEVEQAYQVGGDVDDEEDFDVAIPVSQIVARTTDPGPEQSLKSMIIEHRDQAMERLRQGQAAITERRTRQERADESSRWLAFAQGMLAPTRTGGFGESLGVAAGALRAESGAAFDRQQAIAEEEQRMLDRETEISGDYIDALTNLEGFKNTSRARVVGSITVVDPAQAEAVSSGEMKEEDANRVWANAVMQPSGDVVTSIAKDTNGNPYRVIDPRKDPQQAAAQTAATTGAAAAVTTQFQFAKEGLSVLPMVRRYQRAYQMLSQLSEDTSGLTEAMRRVAQFAGISEVIDDNTTLATLHSMFGRSVLQDLRLLTGSKTDFEYTQIEKMNAGLGKSTGENLAIIDEQLRVLNQKIDKGEFAAQNIAEGPGIESKEFMLEEYLMYRKQQAESAVQYDKTTRIAPSSQIERLIDTIRDAQGDPEEQKFLIDSFREFYDIPDEVQLELRKRGAAI